MRRRRSSIRRRGRLAVAVGADDLCARGEPAGGEDLLEVVERRRADVPVARQGFEGAVDALALIEWNCDGLLEADEQARAGAVVALGVVAADAEHERQAVLQARQLAPPWAGRFDTTGSQV